MNEDMSIVFVDDRTRKSSCRLKIKSLEVKRFIDISLNEFIEKCSINIHLNLMRICLLMFGKTFRCTSLKFYDFQLICQWIIVEFIDYSTKIQLTSKQISKNLKRMKIVSFAFYFKIFYGHFTCHITLICSFRHQQTIDTLNNV